MLTIRGTEMTLSRKPNTYGGGANTNVNGLKKKVIYKVS